MNGDLPHQARRVDPYAARDEQSDPFRRARDNDVDVEKGDAPGRATVRVGDGDTHQTVLAEVDNGHVGYCDCDGFHFHGEELSGGCCAHIVALSMEAMFDDGLITTLDDVVETGGSPVDGDAESSDSDVEVVDDPLSVDVDYDPDENRLVADVVERRELEVDDLFQDGELRLWEDGAGWQGYRREETDDGVAYYRVNTRHDQKSWIDHMRVGEEAVREAVRQHIRDPLAGDAGAFRRRCSPP